MKKLFFRNSFKNLLLTLSLTLSANLAFSAENLTEEFLKTFNSNQKFSINEINKLKNHDIYFIPGILAETLIRDDERTKIKLTLLLKDYYKAQLDLLNKVHGIPAKRLVTSSYDVEETKRNIRNAILNAKKNNRKVIFMSHSLGGLVLLDTLVNNRSLWTNVAGITFLQSPFFGTEIADLLQDPPWGLEKILPKLIPHLNVSNETLKYVGSERSEFMKQNNNVIIELVNTIPNFILASYTEANKTIFKPVVDLNESGCIKAISKCITDVVYHGPYGKTDGLVPFKSAFIQHANYIALKNVDHAELVLNTPYETFNREMFTTSIFKMLIKRIK